jgi:hypothetical protein
MQISYSYRRGSKYQLEWVEAQAPVRPSDKFIELAR